MNTHLDTIQLRLPSEHRTLAMSHVPGGYVALVSLPYNEVTPFATYSVDEDGYCFGGGYFGDLRLALSDFRDIIGSHSAINMANAMLKKDDAA